MARSDLAFPDLFDAIIGATKTTAEITAYSADAASYISNFSLDSEAAWATYGYTGNGIIDTPSTHQYDYAHMYYAWYKMSGYTDATWLSRAATCAVHYRDNYIVANNYAHQPYFSEIKGIALHYAATGNATSLTVVGKMADYLAADALSVPAYTTGHGYFPGIGFAAYLDERTFARTLEAMIVAHAVGASSVGVPSYPAGGNNFLTLAQTGLNRIIAGVQDADGAWRTSGHQDPGNSTIWYVSPFMSGILHDAFILYYNLVDADSRIPTSIEDALTYMFEAYPSTSSYELWQPGPYPYGGGFIARNSFLYVEHQCTDRIGGELEGGAPYGYYDLNGHIINGAAFVYARTGTTIWKTRAELLLNGSLISHTDGNLTYPKRTKQAYGISWKTFPMIMATPDVPVGLVMPWQIAIRCRP